MVIDSSAILSLLFLESDKDQIFEKLALDRNRSMSAVTFAEASNVVFSRTGAEGLSDLDRMLESLEVEIVSVDKEQAILAREAFQTFGKGRHKAETLNFGDCFSYALARRLREPLLFKGNDFNQTDLLLA